MAIVTDTGATRVRLHDVDWETYVALREVPANRNVRMTYDRGTLELMSPSKRHERLAELIGRMIFTWTEERDIPIQSCRTTTFQREDLQRGFEPDNCYYVQNEQLVRGREELDLAIDPPPDLAVEVDVTRSSIDRLAIHAAMGVPEVWRYDKGVLTILQLGPDGHYHERDRSLAFPQLGSAELAAFLDRRNETDETSWIRSFREWVREDTDTADAHSKRQPDHE